jgi:hypothetical protein
VFKVAIVVDRDSGLFASRDELSAQLSEALEGADPGTVSGDNGGEYSVSSWDVEELT